MRQGRRWAMICAFTVLVAGVVQSGERQYVESANDTRPAIWKDSPPQPTLLAEKMARLDSMRKLSELIFGMQIDGNTTVYDLCTTDSTVRAALEHNLAGMRDEGYTYYPDGSCQLRMTVTWRTVVEKVEATITETTKGRRVIDRDTFIKRNLEYHDTDITVWGSGAIEGTDGVKVIQAQRAAEMDAFEKMAQRLCGVSITSNTTVKDMALASDRIKSDLSAVINGVQFTAYRHMPNGVAEADAQVIKALFIQRLEYSYNEERKRGLFRDRVISKEEFLKVTTEPAGELVFTETGKGLAPVDGAATSSTTSMASATGGVILPPASSGLPSGYYYLNARKIVSATVSAGMAVK